MTRPSIALVDDDVNLLEVLTTELEDAGYRVLSARDGLAALALVERERPDAMILDVNMPVLDGLSVCRRLRKKGHPIPVVMLTARDSDLDEALGLELGADDYVSKPFSTRILLARVAALLRRDQLRRSPVEPEEIFRTGVLEIDAARLEVRYRGTLLETTLTELRLIDALARRAGRVLSRTRILDIVRGDDSVVALRIVDTYVRRIRQKLSAVDPEFDRIETVVGAGYRWRDE
jgi:DNA-binding response OmpR family regulator